MTGVQTCALPIYIQDLLLDTGMGTRAYSFIQQGQIDLILSSKPKDRRSLLEEAAGITRYKLRRQEAERRLEEIAKFEQGVTPGTPQPLGVLFVFPPEGKHGA